MNCENLPPSSPVSFPSSFTSAASTSIAASSDFSSAFTSFSESLLFSKNVDYNCIETELKNEIVSYIRLLYILDESSSNIDDKS